MSNRDLAGGGGEEEGLLISEVVVPGFDFADLEFLRKDEMDELLTTEQVRELSWMVKNPEGEE
ncbi:hypothetical protein PENSUB_3887 [Penicillium subrubescens]|uniref:Uncharacterized protein n=1 Tax=Penicillium subrubescens TaxID=1316194 RepID=A0A1Q5UDP0_9EURO|nr:hypothetical protein PENSUB_3887 [Penicillium subrubescens]